MTVLTDKLGRAVLQAIRSSGEQMFTDSQINVPVKTGFLKRSGYRKYSATGYEFGYLAPYAAIINWGAPAHWETVPAHNREAHVRMVRWMTKKGTLSKTRRRQQVRA